MKSVKAWLADQRVRLAGRALIAAAIVAVTQINAAQGGTVAWRALAVGCGLAFVEVFTPLNALVGLFKAAGAAEPPVAK